MKERMTKERLEQLKQRYTDFGSLHWMDAQELEEVVGKPKLHLLSDLHNERIKRENAYTKSERLRKALEEAEKAFNWFIEHGELSSTVADKAYEVIAQINSALGEGDKE